MSLELPEPIAAYFTADRLDSEAVARCFTKDAVVKDEGRTYSGIAAIRRWKSEATTKYSYTSEPLSYDETNDSTIVTSRLTGTFPGSPVNLRFFFKLDRGKISRLEIVP
jgi:SnoaL-like domain